jgi:Tol biopolymer transport system component
MKARIAVPITIIVLLIAAAGILLYAWGASPKLIEALPASGAVSVSAVTPIRLEFSRPMDQASVSSRFSLAPNTQGSIHWEANSLVFIPNQPWSNGMKIQVSLASGARAASWLAFSMAGQSWSFTTRTATLAYLWPSSGKADIYALDPATGDIYQYTKAMEVLDYTASVDGRWFYFSAANSEGGADLYKLDRFAPQDSSVSPCLPEKLLVCGVGQCRNPAVSADGQTLAYEYLLPSQQGSLGGSQVWMLSLASLTATRVGQADHETLQPSWSQAGDLAFYDRTAQAYIIFSPASRQMVDIPNQTGQPGAWSPDGTAYLAPEISYQQVSVSSETASSHLLRYPIDQSPAVELTTGEAIEDVAVLYSPDGSLIAFTRKFLDATRWTSGRQIWLMAADGADPRPVTDEPDFNHYDLAFSRDGASLAYVRFNQEKISDPPELWMISLDGSKPAELVIGGYSPIWIP